MLEYFHADRLHYAVVGTPNRLEYDQGFFVKGGDGLADVKPIAHLYKSQVYALAEFLDVPAAIRTRPPTTDTYSLPQTQEEFYFALPAATLDLVLFAHNLGRDPAAVAAELGRSPDEAARGAQPLGNEDGSVLVVYNGEVYNYLELRTELSAAGHRFRTRSDTEVLVHAYEQWGTGMLGRLNGQFAFAIYDRRTETVLLARDRFGVRPLFYSEQHGDLLFASEIKALFASGEVPAVPDLQGLDEVFTFWAARPPRTVFQGVRSLEP